MRRWNDMENNEDFHAAAFNEGRMTRDRLFNELHNRISMFAQEHDVTYIEIYGVLDAVKFELMRESFLRQQQEEEGGEDVG